MTLGFIPIILASAFVQFHFHFSDIISADLSLCTYRQISNIRRALVGNAIVGHSDVTGASPVGAALTTSLFST